MHYPLYLFAQVLMRSLFHKTILLSMKAILEFPQFYPHSPDFTSIIINNLEKISKI